MMRFKKNVQKLNTEEGATLVELLAGIAILAIIVTSFLAYFVQAGRTNNMTNQMNESTFLAQEEMEQIIYLSQNENTLQQVQTHYKSNGYSVSRNVENDTVVMSKSGGHTLQLKLDEDKQSVKSEEDSSTQLYNVVITVTKGGQSRAQMETVVPFAKE